MTADSQGGWKPGKCLFNPGPLRRSVRFRGAGQAIHVDPPSPGFEQQARQAFSGGAGGQYVINQRQVQALDLRSRAQSEGLQQIALAGFGVSACCVGVSWVRSNQCSRQGMFNRALSQ